MDKLKSNEFAPFYKGYVDLALNDQGIIENLENSFKEAYQLYIDLPESKYLYQYAPNKWTLKELFQHVIDTERILSYRALSFARNDKTELPGFEENDYVVHSNSNIREMEQIIHEFLFLRKSTVYLFDSFTEEQLLRSGVASNSNMSVRALGYIISGHLRHHLNIIKERYI